MAVWMVSISCPGPWPCSRAQTDLFVWLLKSVWNYASQISTTLAAPAAPVPVAHKITPEKVKPAAPCQSASGTEILLKISNTLLLSNISLKLLLLRLQF